MNSAWEPLLDALRDPHAMVGFDLATWDRVVPMAFATGVLGRLGTEARRLGIDADIPPQVWRHLQAMLAVSEEQARAVRQELHHLSDALAELPGPVLLLKGAAYVAAELPPAAGRVFGDIDILVPREQIEATEAALMLGGWVSQAKTAYDQRYYRQWMHEIPPMTHIQRRSVVDLHHAILPPTARIKTRPDTIIDAAVPISGWPRFHLPSVQDLVLHSATHLFHEGEWVRGLRDVVDIDAMWTAGFDDPAGWARLQSRGEALGLTRPLQVVARLRHRLLGRGAEPAADADRMGRDAWAVSAMASAMTGAYPPTADRWAALAAAHLYLRGHWLRMPPGLLAVHLARKALFRVRAESMEDRRSSA